MEIGGGHEKEGLPPKSQALLPRGRKGGALPACLVSLPSQTQLSASLTQRPGPGAGPSAPRPPRPPPAEPSRRRLVLSNPADLPLRAALAPDTVEVLLEMGVTKRLQENAPEREKPREDSKPGGVRRWRDEEMWRGPDVCLLDNPRQDHEILPLLYRLFRAAQSKSTDKAFISVLHKRK